MNKKFLCRKNSKKTRKTKEIVDKCEKKSILTLFFSISAWIFLFQTLSLRFMAKEQSSIRERELTKVREPRRYKVIIYNDDFTTMDFVVKVLVEVFFKKKAEALTLMLKVHRVGQAVVGVYSYDVAVSKVRRATLMARDAGYPLRLTCQPEEE